MDIFPKTFKEEVEEAMVSRGFNFVKLSELTDIPEHYLAALVSHDFKKLPPPPYIRGYIYKIAEILNLDPEMLWRSYSQSLSAKTSGAEDKLPHNRFAFKPVSKAKIAIGILVLFVIIYFGWRAGGFFGTPDIEIINPAINGFTTNEATINLTGKINPQDKLTIKGEEAPTNDTGYFEKQFKLDPGINMIEFKVKRLLGKEIVVTKEIIYQQ